jgi:ABC-type dipeptide/oligopeptide/nickel transport system permease subunit
LLDPRARARFRRSRSAAFGLALVGLLVLFALVGPLVARHSPFESDFAHGVSPAGTPVGPNADFWLGADTLFRDELARVATGARLSLLIGLAATAIASAIGATLGIVAGWYHGEGGIRVPWALLGPASVGGGAALAGRSRAGLIVFALGVAGALVGRLTRARPLLAGPRIDVDTIIMRFVDIGLSFPFLLLVMAIGAALERTTEVTILVTLGLTGWLTTARLLRAKTLQVRDLDFVTASRALGQPTAVILLRHVLPNVVGPLVVTATVSVAQMIIAESALSFLGAGVSPPRPTWGHMLYEGQQYFAVAPWLLVAPATAILVCVFGFNLLGEGVRDALDPKGD